MQASPTQTHPYAITYVADLLNLDEARIEDLCHTLGIVPARDTQTGTSYFNLEQVESLRKAATKRPVAPVAPQQTPPSEQHTAASSTPSRNLVASQSTSLSAAPKTDSPSRLPAKSTATPLSRTELTRIVDTVSSARESILRELSVLLDDKLSGLDELVVELIRSKAENDSLREDLKRLESTRNDAEEELKRFKPAAFGFYRKEKD